MRPPERIENIVKRMSFAAGPEMDRRLQADMEAAQNPSRSMEPALGRKSIGRTIMRSPIMKLAAAIIIVAVVLSITVWEEALPSAYAIEQTLEANQGIRFLHIKNFTAGQNEPREGWLEFDENGQVLRARASMPQWASPTDGPRVIAWHDGVVQMWLQSKNTLATTGADGVQEQLNGILQEFDPRKALARIAELKEQGQVEVTTEEPSGQAKPIVVTVTYLSESPHPGRRSVLSVDRTTKLVSGMERYQLSDGDYQYTGRIELREYNQPIDVRMFDLANEVPADATRLDLSGASIGLAQGSLSDEDVATEVVQQFFKALIASDYEAANRLLPLGTARLKEQFSAVKVFRIVSVGPAVPSGGAKTRTFSVSCTIEIEENNQKKSVTLGGVKVHPLGGQPDRWAIQSLGD